MSGYCLKGVSLLAAAAILLAPAAGCGGGVKPSSDGQQCLKTGEPADGGRLKKIPGTEGFTSAQLAAAEEAVRYAEEANPGSNFKVSGARMADSWSRVDVREVGVPEEEAVAFEVYLKEISEGEWEVMEAGTGLSPEDMPEAPPDIFDL